MDNLIENQKSMAKDFKNLMEDVDENSPSKK